MLLSLSAAQHLKPFPVIGKFATYESWQEVGSHLLLKKLKHQPPLHRGCLCKTSAPSTGRPRQGLELSPRLGEAGSNRHAGGRAEHRDQPCRALADAPCQPRPRWPAIQQSTALGSNMLSTLPGDPMNYPISYEYIPFLHKSGRVVICHFAICN